MMCRFEQGGSGIAGVKGMGGPELCLGRRELPQDATGRAGLELWEMAGCSQLQRRRLKRLGTSCAFFDPWSSVLHVCLFGQIDQNSWLPGFPLDS